MMENKKGTIEELVLALQAGDERAFVTLYDKYYKLVYFIAYELCQNDADAKDVSQETFIQVKKSIGTLNEIENFKPWLNRITINKCKNLFRSNKTVNFDMDSPFFQNSVKEERNYMLPVENMHLKNDQDIMHTLIMKLPLIQREVLLLRYFENLSMKDMAYVLDIPEGTVKTRLLYGKESLKKMVHEYEHSSQVKLDFHCDVAIASVFASSFAVLQLPKIPPVVGVKKLNSFGSSVVSTTIGKVAIVSAMAATGGVGVVAYNQSQQSQDVPVAQPIVTKYENTNARTQYFTLMNWASSEEDMKAKSKEEIASVKQLYITLKQSDSEYYKRLVTDKWSSTYEALLEK